MLRPHLDIRHTSVVYDIIPYLLGARDHLLRF